MNGDRRGLHRSDCCLRESVNRRCLPVGKRMLMRQITSCSPQGLIIDTHVGLCREIIPEEHCKEFWPR